ncbi:MAG: GNAT family N-acetyltransferase [Bacteroidota bacterium]
MLPEYIPRLASADDAPAMADLYAAVRRSGDPVHTADDLQTRMAHFSAREGFTVLTEGEGLLGFGVFHRYSPRGGYRFCAETAVHVHPERRRQGHGTRIKADLVERCAAHGYHHLLARFPADDPAALALYRGFDYETVGIQREIWFRNGHWGDIVVLQRVLSSI